MPDDWNQRGVGSYTSPSPQVFLNITSRRLPDGYDLDKFTESVLSHLSTGYWTSTSLFEISSVEEILTDNHPGRRIRYRVQEEPHHCVLDVEEVMLVSQILPGRPQVFRIMSYMCEGNAASRRQIREDVLNSFKVITNAPLTSEVLWRELEYSHNFRPPDDWTDNGNGSYSSPSPGRLHVKASSHRFPDGYNVDQFIQFVQDNLLLQHDWSFTPELFEIISIDEETTDKQLKIRIRYLVQTEPSVCVLDVEQVVLVSQVIPGYPEVFNLRARMCKGNLAKHGWLREEILDSFEITTKPTDYYTQFLYVKGVQIKAHESVDPAAMQTVAEIIDVMLSGREDIAECMPLQAAGFTIIPRDQTPIDIPEFADIDRVSSLTGRRRDTLDGTRGHGGTRSNPTTTGEEQLLGNWWPVHNWYPYWGAVATHEYAHAIQIVCFTQEDHEMWDKFYEEAVAVDLYPGTHMMKNVREFFAVFSSIYFEVDELYDEDDPSREGLRERYPEIYQALDEIYGGATLPEKFRVWTPRPQ